MPGIAAAVGSQTGGRSQTAGPAGIALLSVAVGVIALFTLLVAVVDARSRADRQAETQAAANAAAVGAAADLPKGTAAVLRSAGRILVSQKAEGLPGRFGAQAIQVGHWDAAQQSFANGAGEPKAVRITVHLSNDRTLCALFPGKPNGIAHRSQRRRRAGFRGNCDRRRRLRDDGHSLIGLFAQAAATSPGVSHADLNRVATTAWQPRLPTRQIPFTPPLSWRTAAAPIK